MRSEFEETLKQHKDILTDELEQLGKHRQAQLVEWDIEKNESDYEFYFNAAWQHQQSKVDELQLKISEDSRILHNVIDIERKKNDELQKRVDELKVGCGLQRDLIKGLETELKKAWTVVDQEAHKNHELVMLLKFIKEHFEMNDLDKAMPRVYEKLEQAPKGGCDASN